MAAAEPVVYGKYQLLELLARGGMAEVFKAKAHGVEGFEKILVIKRILPELSQNPRFVEMFINEAKIAVTLSHANIVQVFDLGRADETFFIAMEYVQGLDLATVLRLGRRVGRPLPPELAVYVVSELAKGLDYAHRRRDANMTPLNIVHRDVSPQNVLISYEGEVKLTDFGIAKARVTVEDDTEQGVLKGKYAYMAPEQASGGAVDARTDLFAVGTVLYEALSGVNPFLSPSTYDTLQRVQSGKVRPIGELVTGLSDELASIVAQAMATEASARHPNAGRLYEALIQFLYASGRRVGAHDLSSYLIELRELGKSEGGEGEDAKFRAAFDDAAASGAREATPVEVPSGRSSARKLPTGVGKPATGTGIARPRAERRDVTALAIRREPGDPLSDTAIARLVQRFGGQTLDSLDKSSGGGSQETVVLFGAREPDGRDTDTAARCALRLARAASASAADAGGVSTVRVGVHAGRILVDLEGRTVRDARHDQLLETARTLAERAVAGEVRTSPAAEQVIRGRFQLERAPADPDGSFVLEGERSFAEAYGKFIGRREELRRIGEILALANRGKLRVIAITGEPGSGKTRLVLESMRRLRLGGHDVGMHFATCAPQNREVPLSSMAEMLRVVLGIDEADSESTVREKVGRLRELGLPAQELGAVATVFGLSVEGAGSGVRPLRDAVLRIATKLAQDRLTVFIWDGVESMDDESQGLVDAVLRGAKDTRVMAILAYRPGFVHAWGDLRGYYELPLGPLADDDVARLTGTRLGAEEVPFELLREVTLKSGGNPLYVEEYLKALSDAGAVEVAGGRVSYKKEVAEVEVPKTLRGIVASRVARLSPAQRHILQIASIAGLRFTLDAVARVAGETPEVVEGELGMLERRGIVVRQTKSEYAFAHDMVQEVLRDGLTVDARRELHGAVAAALEELHPQRLDEMAERLAHHFRESGDRERAVEYLIRAADRLESEQSFDGAVPCLVRAVELLAQIASQDREGMLELHRRIGELSIRARQLQPGVERMAKALELAEALGRDDYVARFSMLRGRLLESASQLTESRRWLDRAKDVALRLGDRVLLRDIALATAELASKAGEHAKAVVSLREALGFSREKNDVPAQIRSLIPLSLALAATGDRQQGLDALAEARRLAGPRPDRFTEVELGKIESLVHFQSRAYEATLDVAGKTLDLAKEYGFTYEIAVNAHNMGEAYLRLGDYKRAFTMLRYSYEVARDQGFVRLQMINMRILGFIDAAKFGSEEGRMRLVQAIEYAAENSIVWDLIEGKYLLAIIEHMRGQPEDARRTIGEVLRLAADNGNKRYVEDCENALAALDAGRAIPLPS